MRPQPIIPLLETPETAQPEGDPLTPLAQGWIPPYTGTETPKVTGDELTPGELTPGEEDQRQPPQAEESESDLEITHKTNTYPAEAATELQDLS